MEEKNEMTNKFVVCLFLLLTIGACGKDKGSNPGPSGANTGVVIKQGDAGEWKGDPAACNAIKACCKASSDTTLMCAMTASSVQGDCAKGLPKIRQYLSESKKTPPPGCM